MQRGNESRPKKLLYVVSEDWAFLCHRLPMARAAHQAGFEVFVAANDTGKGTEIENEGFTFVPLKGERRTYNPFLYFMELLNIHRVLGSVRPDIIHNVALKPILMVGLVSFFCRRYHFIHAITGLGSGFLAGGVKGWAIQNLISFLLKRLARRPQDYFLLQNTDDKDFLLRQNILVPDRLSLIRGSGVDVAHFLYMEEPSAKETIVAAFVGRMLRDKGIFELREAHRKLREKGIKLTLLLAGTIDQGNATSLTDEEMNAWANEEGIVWRGHVSDVRSIWRDAHIAVLPSYREGLPRSLLEAAACGRAIVATDVPGCREIAVTGENAITVPCKNSEALAEALETLALDHDLRLRFSKASRDMVLSDLSAEAVGEATVRLYQRVLNGT